MADDTERHLYVVPTAQREDITREILYGVPTIYRTPVLSETEPGNQIAVYSKEYLSQLMQVCHGIRPSVNYDSSCWGKRLEAHSQIAEIVVRSEMALGTTLFLNKVLPKSYQDKTKHQIQKTLDEKLHDDFAISEIGIIATCGGQKLVVGFQAWGEDFVQYEKANTDFTIITEEVASVIGQFKAAVKPDGFLHGLPVVIGVSPGGSHCEEGCYTLPKRLEPGLNQRDGLYSIVEDKLAYAWNMAYRKANKPKTGSVCIYVVYPKKSPLIINIDENLELCVYPNPRVSFC